jgi:DNA repair ATPase RecN
MGCVIAAGPWCVEAVVTASRWYKCDLQVATPSWDFNLPSGSSYDFARDEDKTAFADRYMLRLQEQGVNVIALADHNSCNWLDVMRDAGKRHGIVVFPGVEVTSASGSDGAHLVLIGELGCTERDIDRVLNAVCGFEEDHPAFNPATGKPAPAPRTVDQILDKLPKGWLAIAPHAFNDNGIASKRTLQGDLRWKALHHDRLSAVDPGAIKADEREGSFNQRFRSRTLDGYPCLKSLSFVSTSDAYSLDSLGSRFTWIRMAEPTTESLRQAFLDHEARIICDWDDRLRSAPDPNLVDHAWIKDLVVGGPLGNSRTEINVSFDPRLNVIIGGRGAGKSTVVAAVRLLYSGLDGLPDNIAEEAKAFTEGVLGSAELFARHYLAISHEEQGARWSAAEGSKTERGGRFLPTSFPVRVLSQKELFERTARNHRDRFAASRHLLTMVDDALAADLVQTADYETEHGRAVNACLTAVAARISLQELVAKEPELRARHAELTRQVEAFGDGENQRERRQAEELQAEQKRVVAEALAFHDTVGQLTAAVRAALDNGAVTPVARDASGAGTAPARTRAQLAGIREALHAELVEVLDKADARIADALEVHKNSEWSRRVQRADQQLIDFQQRMQQLGIDPRTYLELLDAVADIQVRLDKLAVDAQRMPEAASVEQASWAELERVFERRRRRRERLLEDIASRSGSLRFSVKPHGNSSSWVREARELLGLRSDAFVDDVPKVADWIWSAPDGSWVERVQIWRNALVDNDYAQIRARVDSRSAWWSRLAKLDATLRFRLATIFPDDEVTMCFLRQGGKPDNDGDWQVVTTGSPGQRSAAMLSFVLHHGNEPLILDQPEDDLDTAWISQLIVPEIRKSRWKRQVIIVTHNANIPVNGDAENVIVLNNDGESIQVRTTAPGAPGEEAVVHAGPIELEHVRRDIQDILEGGTEAFKARERRYNNELGTYRAALHG